MRSIVVVTVTARAHVSQPRLGSQRLRVVEFDFHAKDVQQLNGVLARGVVRRNALRRGVTCDEIEFSVAVHVRRAGR